MADNGSIGTNVDHRLGFSSLDRETTVEDVLVEGEIPSWLSGVLIRNGPGTWDAGRQKLKHWFDGLAMLHRFSFGNGKVSYSNRSLESPQRRYVEEHGKIGYSEFATDPCRSIFKRLTTLFASPEFGVNASVSVHELDGEMMALTETALPMQFDPETLEAAGVMEFDDDLNPLTSTPHPHTDSLTGDYLNQSTFVSRESSYKIFRVTPSSRRREVIASLPAREPAYIHSFGQTENYVVLAEYPLVANFLKMVLAGKTYAENLQWKPDRPTKFHVIDKRNGTVAGAYEAEPFFCFHHVGAFESGANPTEVVVDLLAYPDDAVIRKFYLDVLRDPEKDVGPAAAAELRRYRLPPVNRESSLPTVDYEVLADEPMELPRRNEERCSTRDYSYVYGIGLSRGAEWTDQLVKACVKTGETRVWREENCYPGEPVFVPKPVSDPGKESEDSGVVLSVVLDARRGSSFLLVLDAESFGEHARARLSNHVPFGFHGGYFGDRV